MKIKNYLLSIVLVFTFVLVGCGSGADTGAEPKKNEATVKAEKEIKKEEEKSSTELKEVLFWHSMGGKNQEKLENIVNGYNTSQDKYILNAQNQGSYDESTSKFFNMNNEVGRPAIIQIGEQNLQSMIDSKLVADVNELIKEFNFPKNEFVDGVINFYTVKDKMYAMPFNASSPVIYYNADALKKAGVDVPRTFEDILAMGDKISEANNGMKTFTMTPYGYALDQMVTNMNGFIINNDNGRSARATEVAYQKELTSIYNFIEDMIDRNHFVAYGRSWDNMYAGFYNQDVAMFITSSASARQIMDQADFEVAIAKLPVFEGQEAQGVYAGGGAICISSNLDSYEKECVMDFLKYATSPEVQALWASDTGYFPVNKKSFDTETIKKLYEEKPSMKIAAEQFINAKQTKATAGPLLAQLPQLRNDIQDALEAVFNGVAVDEAIKNAVTNTNNKIKISNSALGE